MEFVEFHRMIFSNFQLHFGIVPLAQAYINIIIKCMYVYIFTMKSEGWIQKVLKDLWWTRLSYSAPCPPPSSPFPFSKLSLFLSLPVCPVEYTDGSGGRRGGRGAKSYDRKKACPSINHSILSGWSACINMQLYS